MARTVAAKLRVHILQPWDEDAFSYLKSLLAPGVEVTQGSALAVPARLDMLVAGRPQKEHITACPNMRSLIIPWAGLPDATRTLLKGHPQITVHNLHYNATPTAEMAVALLLAAAKCIVPMDRALRAYDWTPRYERVPSVLLAGKTALILGYGAIGRRVSAFCQALNMNVLAIRRDVSQDEGSAIQVLGVAELHHVLPKANALIICLPHTAATQGLIGEHELSLLPKGAILVNVARGPIVNEVALYEALRSHRLHAAGLDVWCNYPVDAATRSNTPPSAYPFHQLDNVVQSPHRASAVDERDRLRAQALARLLNAAADGEPLPNRVDLDAGY
jgi:phosphoglycerate dehydrogenase-like enzyme